MTKVAKPITEPTRLLEYIQYSILKIFSTFNLKRVDDSYLDIFVEKGLLMPSEIATILDVLYKNVSSGEGVYSIKGKEDQLSDLTNCVMMTSEEIECEVNDKLEYLFSLTISSLNNFFNDRPTSFRLTRLLSMKLEEWSECDLTNPHCYCMALARVIYLCIVSDLYDEGVFKNDGNVVSVEIVDIKIESRWSDNTNYNYKLEITMK